jgi:acetoin:2,6-dichlorophenolindophenol oxidoreductase subunit alpha
MELRESDRELYLAMYRKMVLIRTFEDKLYFLFLNTPMPGTMHQYNGQEAVAVGVCSALGNDDYITSTHRGHGHTLAKGADLKGAMAEMFAKDTGLCRGMGGSMHIADFRVGMLGANGIVGGGLPIAAGAALAAQIRGTNQVAVAFMGDAAANEGSWHESVNLAAVWKLPIVFVIENNLYGYSVKLSQACPTEHIATRAVAYGIPGEIVDGQDVLAVYDVSLRAIERAREGGGPSLIECKTYRYKGHARFDPATYRSKEEEEEWKRRDPIKLWAGKLTGSGMAHEGELKAIQVAVRKDVDAAVDFALKSPSPSPDLCLSLIFAETTKEGCG